MQFDDAPLQSEPRSPPRLIIVLNDGDHPGPLKAFIVADTISVAISGGLPVAPAKPVTMCDIVCALLACYYACDLNFPKQYQMLSFLQENLLRDNWKKHFKSSSHLKFLNMFHASQQTAQNVS